MTVEYDVYKSPLRQGMEEETYHVRVKHSGTLTTREIASRIEHDTSLTAGDVRNVLEALSHLFVVGLGSGKRIYLEGIGYFSLAIEAPEVASPRAMRAEHVQVKGIYYLPDKDLKGRLKAVDFERAKYKSHSKSLSEEEVKERLEAYFADHAYIRRADFERLCGFTRATAIRRLNSLLAEGFLCRDGALQSAVYLRNGKGGK